MSESSVVAEKWKWSNSPNVMCLWLPWSAQTKTVRVWVRVQTQEKCNGTCGVRCLRQACKRMHVWIRQIYVHACTHACMHTCMHTYIIHAHIHTYIHTCIHACMHTYIAANIPCLHACIHTYIYVRTYIMHTHTHRRTHIHTCMHEFHTFKISYLHAEFFATCIHTIHTYIDT